MRVIWKAQLDSTKMLVQMPIDAVVRTVMVQDGVPTIWFEGSEDKIKRARRVRIIGTGIEIEDDAGDYVGSYQLGWFVGHVYADGPVA